MSLDDCDQISEKSPLEKGFWSQSLTFRQFARTSLHTGLSLGGINVLARPTTAQQRTYDYIQSNGIEYTTYDLQPGNGTDDVARMFGIHWKYVSALNQFNHLSNTQATKLPVGYRIYIPVNHRWLGISTSSQSQKQPPQRKKPEVQRNTLNYPGSWDTNILRYIAEENDGRADNDNKLDDYLKKVKGVRDPNSIMSGSRVTLTPLSKSLKRTAKLKGSTRDTTYIKIRRDSDGKCRAYVGFTLGDGNVLFTHSMLVSPGLRYHRKKQTKTRARTVTVQSREYQKDFGLNYMSKEACDRNGIRWFRRLTKTWGSGGMTSGRIHIAKAIFFHGTGSEEKLGQFASWGCIRGSNLDLVSLFEGFNFGRGSVVEIADMYS